MNQIERSMTAVEPEPAMEVTVVTPAYNEAESLAVYSTDGELVGYVLCGRDQATGLWKIFRLMIDQHHQGQGYGHAALEAIIRQLQMKPDATDCWLPGALWVIPGYSGRSPLTWEKELFRPDLTSER